MPIQLAKQTNAFLLAFMPFILLPSLSSASSLTVIDNKASESSSSLRRYSPNHRRQHHRRVQSNFFANQDTEWYLPDTKVNIKRTWLFGAGDPSEWGETNGDGGSIMLPTPINVPLRAGEYITDISAGGLHSAILTNEGRIFTAGSSSAGESLGLGRDTMDGTELSFMPVTEVYPINDNTGDYSDVASTALPQFTKVEASQHYTFALDNMGRVWSTGNNAYGQLCLNDTMTRDRFYEVKMPYDNESNLNNVAPEGRNIVDIVLGERHSLLLREDGKAYGCGWNQYGQLGIGVKGQNMLSPVEIMIDAPDDEDVTITESGRQVEHEVITNAVAGRGSSYFLTSSGHVYATGTNYKGQLCLGHRDDRTLPTMIGDVDSFLSFLDRGVDVKSIAAGQSSFYLRLSNGLVLACGDNTYGQLGIGSEEEVSMDVPKAIANVTNVNAIFSGPTSYGAYFVSDRKIYAVGFDGVGARENWNVPNMMACANEDTALEKGVVISSGNDHTLYLATVETTLECEGGTSSSPSVSPSPSMSSVGAPTRPTISPTVSMHPSRGYGYTDSWTTYPTTLAPFSTGTVGPTSSSVPSMVPTGSSAPSISAAPSSSPTASSAPTMTSAPSFAPTGSSAPSTTSAPSLRYETEPPIVSPVKTIPNPSNGSIGRSVGAFGLLVMATSLLWQSF